MMLSGLNLSNECFILSSLCIQSVTGIARNLVLKMENIAPLNRASRRVHHILQRPGHMHIDDCLWKVHDRQTDQHIQAVGKLLC